MSLCHKKSLCLPISPKGLCIAPLLSFLYVGFLHQIRMFMSTYITQGTLHCPLYKISTVNSFRVPMSTCITQVVSMSTYITQQFFKVSMSTCITQVVSQEVSMSTYITQGTLHCPLCKFYTHLFSVTKF